MDKKQDNQQYDFKPVEKRWIKTWDKNQTFHVEINLNKPKFYCLDTWAYPSAEGVHIGYVKSFGGMDVMARYKRMKGFNVLYPTGWDTLGLPAENYALKARRHPREITDESIKTFVSQFKAFGLSYDWNREINTADPSYYKWTQWLFLVMYENGLAYRKKSKVNWCPNDKTVLANEQVIDGKCERCGATVIQKELMQWFFKVTDYADRLYEDCSKLQWGEKYLNVHKSWIGKRLKKGKVTFNVRDWCVSRQRYWGPPIPIIYCNSCGTVPVPKSELPVVLPYDIDFTPTGESPLTKDESFVNTTCPKCGRKAKREVDILDTFVSSSWYEFRFADPHNNTEFVSKEAINYWQNVDHYEGTIEHLTAHLIYARFVTKVLYDKKYLPFDEPFPKYTPVGLLVDRTGTKFSKRLGNAPNTNELIEKYGGDLLRLSCQFITPFDDISKWGEQDIVGVKKFRDRVWRTFKEKVDGEKYKMPDLLIKQMHKMVKDVEENIETMKYNVALSTLMVFINDLVNYDGMLDKALWETFTKVLAPFAPFIAEEMWHEMGNETSVHLSSWPTYDKNIIKQETVKVVVQTDGKLRGVVEVPTGSEKKRVLEILENRPEFKEYVKESKNQIFVKDKVINFVY